MSKHSKNMATYTECLMMKGIKNLNDAVRDLYSAIRPDIFFFDKN